MLVTKTKTYKAMGFVEALIAIMIAGIASVVLMNIAASALKEAVQNERIDKMTEYAVEGANIVRSAVASTNITFSSSENCYIPVKDSSEGYTFHKQGGQYWSSSPSSIIPNNSIVRNNIGKLPKIGDNSDFFRIACIRQNATPAQYLIVRIGIAHIPSTGKITNEKEMKDYFYTTTINL